MILVTGGTGFIGPHLVARLVEQGEDVRVFGTFSRSLPSGLDMLRETVEFHQGDIRDAVAITKAMDRVETVYHLGGVGSPSAPIEQYREILSVNILGTENVLSAALQNGVSKIVVASSASVYGTSPESPKREAMRPEPQSVYAASKVAAEHLCAVFNERHGLETVAIRFFNVYGPGQDRDGSSAMVVPSFVRALQHGAPVTLYGDGMQTRDFIYIDDVISGTLSAGTQMGISGRAINLGSGQPKTITELVERLATAMDVTPQITYAPEREKEVRTSVADISLARDVLGFAPVTAMREGLRRIVQSDLVETGTDGQRW